jgi:hypothetical protein
MSRSWKRDSSDNPKYRMFGPAAARADLFRAIGP